MARMVLLIVIRVKRLVVRVITCNFKRTVSRFKIKFTVVLVIRRINPVGNVGLVLVIDHTKREVFTRCSLNIIPSHHERITTIYLAVNISVSITAEHTNTDVLGLDFVTHWDVTSTHNEVRVDLRGVGTSYDSLVKSSSYRQVVQCGRVRTEYPTGILI